MRPISAAHIGAGMVLFLSGTWSTYEVPQPLRELTLCSMMLYVLNTDHRRNADMNGL